MARARTRLEKEPGLGRLWAPWRARYVRASRRDSGCIFCLGRLSSAARKRHLVLHQSSLALVMLNRYPYNNGHLLIAPRRHRSSLELLTTAERAALAELTTESVRILKRALLPGGFNLGMNLGRMAGAGFAGHLHWHVVPRWQGDTNFMPALSASRVISVHLEASFKLLQPLFNQLERALSWR